MTVGCGDKPTLVGGIGNINFGKQYRQGNRVYDSTAIAMCLTAQPLGNTECYIRSKVFWGLRKRV